MLHPTYSCFVGGLLAYCTLMFILVIFVLILTFHLGVDVF